jgi:hypothetical protein
VDGRGGSDAGPSSEWEWEANANCKLAKSDDEGVGESRRLDDREERAADSRWENEAFRAQRVD